EWTVKASLNTADTRFFPYDAKANASEQLPQEDRKDVVNIRGRLGLLTKWTTGVSDTAVALATAIEIVLNELFMTEKTGSTWSWSMHSTLEGHNILLSATKAEGGWISNAAEIEAALSLWTYSAQSHQKHRSGTETDTLIGNDWLRMESNTLRPTNLRLL